MLYGEPAQAQNSYGSGPGEADGAGGSSTRATARILDVLTCIAPPSNMTLAVPFPYTPSAPGPVAPPVLLLCCGRGRSGALAQTSPGIRLRLLSSRQIGPAQSAFTP
eukprot:scaffold24812_cov67-Isochrysis_galbana.AAC.1